METVNPVTINFASAINDLMRTFAVDVIKVLSDKYNFDLDEAIRYLSIGNVDVELLAAGAKKKGRTTRKTPAKKLDDGIVNNEVKDIIADMIYAEETKPTTKKVNKKSITEEEKKAKEEAKEEAKKQRELAKQQRELAKQQREQERELAKQQRELEKQQRAEKKKSSTKSKKTEENKTVDNTTTLTEDAHSIVEPVIVESVNVEPVIVEPVVESVIVEPVVVEPAPEKKNKKSTKSTEDKKTTKKNEKNGEKKDEKKEVKKDEKNGEKKDEKKEKEAKKSNKKEVKKDEKKEEKNEDKVTTNLDKVLQTPPELAGLASVEIYNPDDDVSNEELSADDISEAEEEEEEIEVKVFMHKSKRYLIDPKSQKIYDNNTQECIGIYNKEKDIIEKINE
jgi:hypothetical protein